MIKIEELKIEKNIPVPPRRFKDGLMAVFKSMKPNDSVLIPMKARSNIGQTAKRAGIKYTARAESDTHVRVWRIQ